MAFNLILMQTENGEELPQYNEKGEVLVHELETGSMMYVPLSNEILEAYPQLAVQYEYMDTAERDLSANSKAYWTYDATIMLINKYNVHKPKFADSIHKNVQVWEMIAGEFVTDGYSFTGAQCENRWKYIRGRYVKKKDNSGPGSTGDEFFKFEYYNEMDAVLGKQPNIVPKYVASSEKGSSGYKSPNRASNFDKFSPNTSRSSLQKTAKHASRIESPSPPSTPRSRIESPSTPTSSDNASRSKVGQRLNDLASNSSGSHDEEMPSIFLEERHPWEDPLEISDNKHKGKQRKEPWDETAKRQDRYHNDMMEIQRETLDTFKDVMSKFLEKF